MIPFWEIDCSHPPLPPGCGTLRSSCQNGPNSWSPGWSRLQAGDQRGGQLVSELHRRRPLPPPRASHQPGLPPSLPPSPSISSSTLGVDVTAARRGLTEFRRRDTTLACRMLTIRQRTLIAFNWKSIMGLIAGSPCCPPRMAPVMWGPPSTYPVADHAAWRIRLTGLATGRVHDAENGIKNTARRPRMGKVKRGRGEKERKEGKNQTPPNLPKDHYSPITRIRDRST